MPSKCRGPPISRRITAQSKLPSSQERFNLDRIFSKASRLLRDWAFHENCNKARTSRDKALLSAVPATMAARSQSEAEKSLNLWKPRNSFRRLIEEWRLKVILYESGPINSSCLIYQADVTNDKRRERAVMIIPVVNNAAELLRAIRGNELRGDRKPFRLEQEFIRRILRENLVRARGARASRMCLLFMDVGSRCLLGQIFIFAVLKGASERNRRFRMYPRIFKTNRKCCGRYKRDLFHRFETHLFVCSFYFVHFGFVYDEALWLSQAFLALCFLHFDCLSATFRWQDFYFNLNVQAFGEMSDSFKLLAVRYFDISIFSYFVKFY